MSRAEVSLSSVRALARKRRWTEEEARRIVAFGEERDSTWSAFAQELGVDVVRLHWWRRRLEARPEVQRSAAAAFVPLIPVGVSPDGTIEIILENGRRVSIGAGTSSELAAAVLRVLLC